MPTPTVAAVLAALTDEQIRALGNEAADHDDGVMVDLCHEALGGDEAARLAVAEAIQSTQAMR